MITLFWTHEYIDPIQVNIRVLLKKNKERQQDLQELQQTIEQAVQVGEFVGSDWNAFNLTFLNKGTWMERKENNLWLFTN